VLKKVHVDNVALHNMNIMQFRDGIKQKFIFSHHWKNPKHLHVFAFDASRLKKWPVTTMHASSSFMLCIGTIKIMKIVKGEESEEVCLCHINILLQLSSYSDYWK